MRTPGGLEESEWVAAEELVAGEQLTDLGRIGEQVLSPKC